MSSSWKRKACLPLDLCARSVILRPIGAMAAFSLLAALVAGYLFLSTLQEMKAELLTAGRLGLSTTPATLLLACLLQRLNSALVAQLVVC